MGVAILKTDLDEFSLELVLSDDMVLRWAQEALLAQQLKNNTIKVSPTNASPEEEKAEEKESEFHEVVKELRKSPAAEEKTKEEKKKEKITPPKIKRGPRPADPEAEEKLRAVLETIEETEYQAKSKSEIFRLAGVKGTTHTYAVLKKLEREYIDSSEGAQEPSKDENKDENSVENIGSLSDSEGVVLDALEEKKWFRFKTIQRKVNHLSTFENTRVTLKKLVERGYVRKEGLSYSKISGVV